MQPGGWQWLEWLKWTTTPNPVYPDRLEAMKLTPRVKAQHCQKTSLWA
jgi:hypothetical protein